MAKILSVPLYLYFCESCGKELPIIEEKREGLNWIVHLQPCTCDLDTDQITIIRAITLIAP